MLATADEAKMFKWAADNGADVISCSWGPSCGIGEKDLLPDNVAGAIQYCATEGRAKKGIPICWAAGNGDELVSDDGYASNPDVMAIAASTSPDSDGAESHAPYSDHGPEIWVCAPSSGNRRKGDKDIFTVDRRGNAGYNVGTETKGDKDGNYTNDFGGTSSAAPFAAGIAALILSVNPRLTSDQVREIIKNTADQIGDRSTYSIQNGRDQLHSDFFGFGRINAIRAVEAAKRST